MSEIMRVAPWSLRALGHPFGVAERATRLLAWTQAALGQGLEILRFGEEKLMASNRLPPARRSGDSAQGRLIEAGGRNLFELGPPAVDLATADARIGGSGRVAVTGAIGNILAPSLAELAARRGLNAMVVYRGGENEIHLPGFPRAGWVAAMPGAGGPRFFAGETVGGGWDGPAEMISISIGAAAALPDNDAMNRSVDYPGRVARAYREGLEIAAEDLEQLYALEKITWAPTSERSRKQAGY
jgi:hypothetical protein